MTNKKLRRCQVGNTSSRKNTEVKQLGPRLALQGPTKKRFFFQWGIIEEKKYLD